MDIRGSAVKSGNPNCDDRRFLRGTFEGDRPRSRETAVDYARRAGHKDRRLPLTGATPNALPLAVILRNTT